MTSCGERSIRVFYRPSSAPNDTKEANNESTAGKSHTITSHKQLYAMPLSQSFRSSVKSITHSKASKKVQQNDFITIV